MTQDHSTITIAPDPNDASGVEGPAGEATLKDPSKSGADLEGLRPIDVPSKNEPEEGGSIDGALDSHDRVEPRPVRIA